MKKDFAQSQLQRKVAVDPSQSLLDLSANFIRRLRLESIEQVSVEREVKTYREMLTEHRKRLPQQRAKDSLVKSRRAEDCLKNALHAAKTQLGQLTAENAQMRAQIAALRIAITKDKEFIQQTEAELQTVKEDSAKVQEARLKTESRIVWYRDEIHRFASAGRKGVQRTAATQSPVRSGLHKRQSSLSVPVLEERSEARRAGVLNVLVAKWKARGQEVRSALDSHREFVARLVAAFALIRNSTPQESAEEIKAWNEKERALTTHLNLISDEVELLEATVHRNKGAIFRLSETPGSGSGAHEFGPLVTALMRECSLEHSPEELQTAIRRRVEALKNEGKLASVSASVKCDMINGVWMPMAELKNVLLTAGFGPRKDWANIGFSLEATLEHVNELERTLQELETFLRGSGGLPRYDQLTLSPKATHPLAPAAPHISDSTDVHYALSVSEFHQRAAETLRLKLPAT